MRRRFRLPMFVIAAALFGLIALLATLQYQWLGRISEAERESRRSTLTAKANAFASDFDKELTLAYMLFQVEPVLDGPSPDDNIEARLGARYERWTSTARYPRMIKDYYVASRQDAGDPGLRRFNPAARSLERPHGPSRSRRSVHKSPWRRRKPRIRNEQEREARSSSGRWRTRCGTTCRPW